MTKWRLGVKLSWFGWILLFQLAANFVTFYSTLLSTQAYAAHFRNEQSLPVPIGLALLQIVHRLPNGQSALATATGFAIPGKKIVTAAHFLMGKNITKFTIHVWDGTTMLPVTIEDYYAHKDHREYRDRQDKYAYEVDYGVVHLRDEVPTSFRLPSWERVKSTLALQRKELVFHGFSMKDNGQRNLGGYFAAQEWRVSNGPGFRTQNSHSVPLRLHLEARGVTTSIDHSDSGGPLYVSGEDDLNYPIAIGSFLSRENGKIFANSFQVLTPKLVEWIQSSTCIKSLSSTPTS